jgi:hypothetical protein
MECRKSFAKDEEMKVVKRFLLFVAAETISMGLFFWLGGAWESLQLRQVGDLFSRGGATLILWGSIMSFPFIFAGALVCALFSIWLRTTYYRLFCLVVGFASVFPLIFFRKIENESLIFFIPGSLALILWLVLSDLLRVQPTLKNTHSATAAK